MSIKQLLLIGFITTNLLLANDFNIDNLLQDIEMKSDLSEKTKLANGGVSIIYTRDDIDRMQIKNIKDILKSVFPFGYNENRFGIPDPLYSGSRHPYLSSQMKVFIDNQEISVGMYGSGLFLMGDINMQWVDHIEIYSQSPSYEYTTESTGVLIKLYTKSVKKDEGNKVEISAGSYGASVVNFYQAEELDNEWSYFAFVSNEDNKRKKYYSSAAQISRDINRQMLLATFNKDNHNILLTAITQSRDGFIDASIDASPETSTLDGDSFHIGYDTKIDNLSYLLSYDYMKTKSIMIDNVIPIQSAPFNGLFPLKSNETSSHSDVLTAELKYNIKTTKNHTIMGLKHRTKRYVYDKSEYNGIQIPRKNNDLQSISTVSIENRYFLKENSIITVGGLYSIVRNNYSIQDDNLFMYRLGHTYTTEEWTAKTIASHSLTTLDPYIIDSSTYLATPNSFYEPQITNSILENIIYQKNNNKYEVLIGYTIMKDFLVSNSSGKLELYDKDIHRTGLSATWTHSYNEYDTLSINFDYRRIANLPKTDKFKNYKIMVRTVNTYQKFDIFNELLYRRDTDINIDFYDYSAGVKYNHTDSLTISLKGINLLDKAQTTKYIRKEPTNPNIMLAPLEVSPIDRSIMLSLEYSF